MTSPRKSNKETPRESATQRVISAIVDDISIGNLPPGERIDEVSIAKKLGVSRTPVREAFNQLVAQKILMVSAGRGVSVAEYSREELSQIFEVMFEIEIACARLAAQRLTFLTRSEIEAAQAECIKAAEKGDRVEYVLANEVLHATIYQATGNKYMKEMASEFRRRTGPFRARKLRTSEDLIESAQSHIPLLQTIFSADSEVAAKGMREHMAASFLQTLKYN